MKAIQLIAALCLVATGAALANGENLDLCLYNNGRPMEPKVCDILRKKAAQDAEAAARARERMAAQRALAEKNREAADAAKAVERARQEEERAAYQQKETERVATFRREEADRERQQAAEEAAQKRKCGKDYQILRVGMTLERYEECNEALTFVTTTVSKGATVETYRSAFSYINVKNGQIVSYTRRWK